VVCPALVLPADPMNQLTTILDGIAAGQPQAGEHLLPLVYEELRKLAASRMAREWDTSTLQPTALVHEAWLRLAGSERQTWKNQGHFFGAAAEAMRRILIDQARRKHALKRQAGSHRVDLDKVDVAVQADEESLLLIDEALQKLAAQDAQCAELVKLRFFVGMGYEEAARALGISERSAKRYWTFARAWLYRELRGSAGGSKASG
jgi:RNA polymerase sigma factor (TIGR02999 family)